MSSKPRTRSAPTFQIFPTLPQCFYTQGSYTTHGKTHVGREMCFPIVKGEVGKEKKKKTGSALVSDMFSERSILGKI